MQNAWVLTQEIPINPEFYHPCLDNDTEFLFFMTLLRSDWSKLYRV